MSALEIPLTDAETARLYAAAQKVGLSPTDLLRRFALIAIGEVPPVGRGTLTKQLNVRCDPVEAEGVRLAASQRRLPVSEFVRQAMLGAMSATLVPASLGAATPPAPAPAPCACAVT